MTFTSAPYFSASQHLGILVSFLTPFPTLGVIIGTAILRVLRNMMNMAFLGFQRAEFAVIGAVILGGVIADELAKRAVARKRSAQKEREKRRSDPEGPLPNSKKNNSKPTIGTA